MQHKEGGDGSQRKLKKTLTLPAQGNSGKELKNKRKGRRRKNVIEGGKKQGRNRGARAKE